MLSAELISFFTGRQGETNKSLLFNFVSPVSRGRNMTDYVCGVVTSRDTSLPHGEDSGSGLCCHGSRAKSVGLSLRGTPQVQHQDLVDDLPTSSSA